MKRIAILIIVALLLTTPVSAVEFTAPEAPASAEKYMPDDTESFWDGFFEILKNVIAEVSPRLTESLRLSASLLAIILILSVIKNLSNRYATVLNLVAGFAISITILTPTTFPINQSIQAVQDISEYGKLLLPVMTAAMAAQGIATTSASLYAGTTVFNAILNTAISALIIPAIYVYIALSVACCSLGQDILKKLCEFVKWLITWILKAILYLFTGYIGITGVIGGVTDAIALKTTKLAISGLVPFVGNVLSDASETVLLSAAIVKNTAGIYGFLVIIAICAGPFISIGAQYLFLKATAGICSIYGTKETTDLLQSFSCTIGFLLAIVGVMVVIFLVSIVCFMKGIANV